LIPEPRFVRLPKEFWANVRTISEQAGYTIRGTGQIKVPSIGEIKSVFKRLGLSAAHLINVEGRQTSLGETIGAYFEHRAHILNSFVEPHLMDAAQARREFSKLKKTLSPT
jgi:hypothetical protein